MKLKRNILFPAVLLVVIMGMTAVAAPVFVQKYGQSLSFTGKSTPGATSVSGNQGSAGLPDTGLQGQIAQAAALDCTYHYGYWKAHPELWPDSLTIGPLTYTKQQAADLFNSNVGIDQVAAAKNPIQSLALQTYITTLNIKQGASQYEIQQTLAEATNWLAQNTKDRASSVFDGSVGVNLAQNLEDYNNGFTGPGLCPNQPPRPKLTIAPTDTLTTRPSQTPTAPPKQVTNLEKPQDQKQNEQNPPAPPPPPTATPSPTSAPTATPVPPSATPVPPTQTPLPTATQAPPSATPTPTEEPKPPHKTPKPKPTKKPNANSGSLLMSVIVI